MKYIFGFCIGFITATILLIQPVKEYIIMDAFRITSKNVVMQMGEMLPEFPGGKPVNYSLEPNDELKGVGGE